MTTYSGNLSHKLAVRPEKEAYSLAELLSSGALPESQTLSQCQKHIERESENGGGAKGKGERMRRKPPATAVALTRWPTAGAKRDHTLVKRKRVRREKGVKESSILKFWTIFLDLCVVILLLCIFPILLDVSEGTIAVHPYLCLSFILIINIMF